MNRESKDENQECKAEGDGTKYAHYRHSGNIGQKEASHPDFIEFFTKKYPANELGYAAYVEIATLGRVCKIREHSERFAPWKKALLHKGNALLLRGESFAVLSYFENTT